MIKSKDNVYLLSVDGRQDIVYGIWEQNSKVAVGLQSHSLSFEPMELLSDDDKLSFKLEHGETVEIELVTKKLYDSLRGGIVPETSPEISSDSDVQEYFWSEKTY